MLSKIWSGLLHCWGMLGNWHWWALLRINQSMYVCNSRETFFAQGKTDNKVEKNFDVHLKDSSRCCQQSVSFGLALSSIWDQMLLQSFTRPESHQSTAIHNSFLYSISLLSAVWCPVVIEAGVETSESPSGMWRQLTWQAFCVRVGLTIEVLMCEDDDCIE